MISPGKNEVRPYTARNELGALEAVATVLGEPEIQLNEEDRAATLAFARGLHDGRIGEMQVESHRTLGQVYRLNPEKDEVNIYHGCIEQLTPALVILGCISVEQATDFDTFAVARKVSADIARAETIDLRFIRNLAAQSNATYRGQMTERLREYPAHDAEQPDVNVQHLQFSPSVLLEKCADLQAYRRFYRQVWNMIKNDTETPLTTAQKTLTTIHMARANSLLAAQYPALAQLAEQLDISPETEVINQWRAQLSEVAPSVAAAWQRDDNNRSQFHADFARRNDYIRNGVALDADGRISPVSTELQAFAASVERGEELNETRPAQVSPETVERVRRTAWQADRLHKFLRYILTDWELLSAEECDWHAASERDGRAADNKWQVIITPKVHSLSADGRKKVVWVPEKFNRSLLQQVPSGALPVSAHELAHVLQTEADDELAEQLPLAGMKGRRSVTIKEMGGIYYERKLQAYFGNGRPVNTTYLRALQAKMGGHNNTEVARAFIEARRLTHPDDSERVTAKSGAAATRLNRHDGFDSQPLDYLAQGYILSRLKQHMDDDTLAAYAIAGTAFSLQDTAALRAVNLFELPRSTRFDPTETVIRCYFEAFYQPDDD